jgi:hydroxymethylbilane synthase
MALLRLGSRGSPLALAQTQEVRDRLAAAHSALAAPEAIEIVVIRTTGDRIQDRPLAEIGGKGLFTKEIEEALLDRRIDVAVHSMKDVPTWLPDGLEISVVLPREDPRDAFFSPHGDSLEALPAGAVVGTASLRRQAQVLARRPDLSVVALRGNVDTRLRKLAEGQVDATLLAAAGLKRLKRADDIQALLETEVMLPAVAQGAIGLESRQGDQATYAFIEALNDPLSLQRITAERACLAVLEGSCRTPIAVLAEAEAASGLYVRGLVAEPDGSQVERAELRGPARDAAALGRDLGEELRRRLGEDFFARLAEH